MWCCSERKVRQHAVLLPVWLVWHHKHPLCTNNLPQGMEWNQQRLCPHIYGYTNTQAYASANTHTNSYTRPRVCGHQRSLCRLGPYCLHLRRRATDVPLHVWKWWCNTNTPSSPYPYPSAHSDTHPRVCGHQRSLPSLGPYCLHHQRSATDLPLHVRQWWLNPSSPYPYPSAHTHTHTPEHCPAQRRRIVPPV